MCAIVGAAGLPPALAPAPKDKTTGMLLILSSDYLNNV